VHGDLHDDNSRWTPNGWQILDWSDACVAHPVVDLASPLLNVEPSAAEDISARFAHVWSKHALPNHLDQVMAAAPALGAAHQIETHRWLVDDIGASEKHVRPIRHWLQRLLAALRNETRSAVHHVS
jgi:Ser/Thr protein kinase RdoA (MazF antagonist)